MKPDYDRAKGCIFGCALGDALGLPAEGSEKRILAARYPDGIALPHRCKTRGFPLNDWTDDTDQTVLVMRALQAQHHGEAAGPSFAKSLKKWYYEGFAELGDTCGLGCGGMTWRVLKRDDFEEDPYGAARSIVGPKAGNGALMRTAPCAFTSSPATWAEHLCATTHADPLASASCVAQCLLLRELATLPSAAAVTGDLLRRALTPAVEKLSPPQRREFMEWAAHGASGSLELDARDARSYTLKAFACSLWAFRRMMWASVLDETFFKETLTLLVMEGGDADTNAATAGACLGARLGYSNLPESWLEVLPNREWLAREVDS